MKRIVIAVLTDYDLLFSDLKHSKGNVDYIRVYDVENVRGRQFDGYCTIGSLNNIKDAYELINIIESRLKQKV